jgi:hypothetical protein
VVGADLRIGERTIDSQSSVDVFAPTTFCVDYGVNCPGFVTLHEGEFRSARLYAGIRF